MRTGIFPRQCVCRLQIFLILGTHVQALHSNHDESMRTKEIESPINWHIVLSVLGVVPPIGLMMILTHWYKFGKYSPLSILCFLLGIAYSVMLSIQIYKLL